MVRSRQRVAVARYWLFAAGFIALVLFAVPSPVQAAEPPARPNVLWITIEDMSPCLGCYGDDYADTPVLDRLAAEGVRYTNAFATASVCTPARSSLITGVFASSMGTQDLRGEQPLSEQIHCFPELLRRLGYYCTNNSKEDYNFPTPKAAWDESSKKAHWRGRRPGQPFFAVFNLMTTHQSRVRFSPEQFAKLTSRLTDEQRHNPDTVPLPPYYPDTPVVRRDVARVYDMLTAADYQAGDFLAQLEQDGLADDTIVFFYSDHGTGMPRHKRWLYDSGTRVPLIIRFPKKYAHLAPGKPGQAIDRLVSFDDFGPTVLSLAGAPIPDYVQGRAFLGEQATAPREYVYAIRDRVDECFEMSRAVRDGRYRYIRNFMPHRPRMQHSDFSEQTPTRHEIRRLAAEGKLTGAAADFFSPRKAPEELYDTLEDPYEVHNLADDPQQSQRLTQMRRVLLAWMTDARDTALLPEVEMCLRADGQSPYDMARHTDKLPVRRLLPAADLIGRGAEHRPELVALLGHSDSALRYWGAEGLAALGQEAAPAADALRRALKDQAPDVRLAAAEALCRIGRTDEALPVLTKALDNPIPRVRLTAAARLVAIGPAARGATEAMQKVVRRKSSGNFDMYTRWALQWALEQLGQPEAPEK